VFARIVLRRSPVGQVESPFWISFSDLMSALMTLFLVVMCVTLLAVTRNVNVTEQHKVQREQDIAELMSKLRDVSRQWPEIRVDLIAQRIDLGEIVRFDSGRFDISRGAAEFLRSYIPVVLEAQRSQLGNRWMRRIVVEGFADQDGDYLYNLGLSLNRSKEVVCALYRPSGASERALTDDEKRQIRALFLVGGYSFNSTKASRQASRRVELKLEFWPIDETPAVPAINDDKGFGRC
jgi:outer membrane protein OmpA-like peptidoglycan-associated protein